MQHAQFFQPIALAPARGHTPVVVAGPLIFLSGQVAVDAFGNLIGRDDFRVQAQQIFENIKSGLKTVGADMNHLVKLDIYLLDRSSVPLLEEVRDCFVDGNFPPASTLVEVANLLQDEFLIEITAIAYLP
jgi:enamine deaminase RidA (YjgF/YER057c/UK114 family)